MKQYINPSSSTWASLIERPTEKYETLEPLVASVFDAVKLNGDDSVISYTAEFDGIQQTDFKVSEAELNIAESDRKSVV